LTLPIQYDLMLRHNINFREDLLKYKWDLAH
jgi:hypothetical protein